MKTKTIAAVLPFAFLLSACTTVEPVYKDIGTRIGSCVDGGPDRVAQAFYDLRIQQGAAQLDGARLGELQPYLSQPLYQELLRASQQPGKLAAANALFSGSAAGPTSANVASASTIQNTDAKNIPLRVALSGQKAGGNDVNWQNEVLMVREGTCWTVNDIRYLNPPEHVSHATLRQTLEDQ